ncbi:MAG: metallopeptidase TldD-related protein [Bacteroidales bacterium]|nr:metallopeptidase TldD-related protein [Bacteroidales bacterium]
MKLKAILFAALLCVAFTDTKAKEEKETILFQAMNDELSRTMSGLSLPNMQKPFFCAYTIRTNEVFQLTASFGELTFCNGGQFNQFRADLMVGDYHRANFNFTDASYVKQNQSGNIPVDYDYDEIRRNLWLASDGAYKDAATEYDAKMLKWKQMNVSPEMEALDDLSKITPIEKKSKHRFEQTFSRKEYWKKTAEAVTSVFTKYPDIIDNQLTLQILSSDDYYMSNEGSKIVNPQDWSNLEIIATVRTEDGGNLTDRIYYEVLNDADIPSKDSIIRAAEELAQRIIALKNAPKVNETYDGPVLFEGMQVVAQLSKFNVYGSGMTGYRTSLNSNERKSMEERLNRKILPINLNVTSIPGLKEFNGVQLYGAYEVDAEGVVPPEKLVMVENGILRNVANDRIPTLRTPLSNGHCKPSAPGSTLRTNIQPGVINFEATNGESKKQLKEKLIQLAKEGGEEYAYILRGTDISKPLIYRVSVKDGSEQLMRGGTISNIDVRQMKKMAGICSEQTVTNMRYNQTLTSYICPSSILLEDIELSKDGIKTRDKKPVVASPLADLQKNKKIKK